MRDDRDPITRDDLLVAVREIMASLTNDEQTGALDKQHALMGRLLTHVEKLTARVEVLELEALARRTVR